MSERGPAVLIVGGLMTSPPFYWPMRRRLLRRGASRVAIAPLFGLHWLIGTFVGLGPATSAVARAMDRLSEEDGGRPILVVGHSGGGIVARLALAQLPFDGALRARPGSVGAVVTLGAPHLATRVDGTAGRHGRRALRFLARNGSPPSAAHDGPRWLTVGSKLLRPGRGDRPAGRRPLRGGSRLRWAYRGLAEVCYVALLGPRGRHAEGDGMVPLETTPLPPSEHLILEGVTHGPFVWGARWYGCEEALDGWWDRAVEVWREAVSSADAESPGVGRAASTSRAASRPSARPGRRAPRGRGAPASRIGP